MPEGPLKQRLERLRADQEAGVTQAEKKGEELPPIKTLKIDVTDGRGRRYRGDFVYKVPNLKEQVQITALKASMLPQGGMADPQGAILCEMLAYCTVTLQKTPSWWDPEAFYDASPLTAVYQEALAYEGRFLGRTDAIDRRSKSGAASGEEATEDGEAAVGRKLQPPSERRETLVSHGEGSDSDGGGEESLRPVGGGEDEEDAAP